MLKRYAARSPRRGWRALPVPVLLAAVAAVLVILGAGLFMVVSGGRQPAAPSSSPTVDPRLIVHPRTVPIDALLTGGARLSGTLYPAYPGRNTLRLEVVWPGGAPRAARLGASGRVTLAATMPGMAMSPVRGTLAASGHGYSGTLTLTMFGTYRVSAVVRTPSLRATGTLTVTLPLPGL